MKTLYTALILLSSFIYNASQAQTPVSLQWQRCVGGPGHEWVSSVKKLSDGFIYVANTTASGGDVMPGYHFNSAYPNKLADIWVVRTDMDGNILWQRIMGGIYDETSYDIEQTPDGGFIFIGAADSNDGDVSGNHQPTGPDHADGWVVKLDANGNTQWQKCIGGSDIDDATGIEVLGNEYIILIKGPTSDGDFANMPGTTIGFYGFMKLDASGNILARMRVDSNGARAINDFKVLSNGNMIVSGVAGSTYPGGIYGGTYDAWLAEMDTLGNIIWEKRYGGSADDKMGYITILPDSSYIIEAATSSNDFDVSGYHGGTGADAWILKTDSSGNIQWKKCYGGTKDDGAVSILPMSDGTYYASFISYSSDGDFGSNRGAGDIWIVQLDASGNILNKKQFGGSGNDYDAFLLPGNTPNTLMLFGDTESDNGDINGFHPGIYPYSADIWLVKLSTDFNTMKGKVFLDKNENGIRDANEQYLDSISIISNKVNGIVSSSVLTAGGGAFIYTVDTGAYSTHLTQLHNYYVLPAPRSTNFSTYGNLDSFDYALTPAYDTLSGYVYVDKNNNNVFNAGEAYYTNGQIISYKGTDTSKSIIPYGTFKHTVSDTGKYVSKLLLYTDEFTILPDSISRTFTKYGMSDTTVNFRVVPKLDRIKGHIFIDWNNDGVKGINEPYVNDGYVKSQKNGLSVQSQPVNGAFRNVVDTGTYTTTPVLIRPYFTSVPASKTSVFTQYNKEDSVEFALQPIPGQRDLAIQFISLSRSRRGFPSYYKIVCINRGTDTITGYSVKVKQDHRLIYSDAHPAPVTITADSIVWNFSTSLKPLDTATINLVLGVQFSNVSIGDTLSSIASIDPVAGDLSPADDTSLLLQRVTGSFDPNDKAENHDGAIPPSFISNGEYLTYVIRFQNTGNDTAFNISIRDTLDAKLDWTSIQLVSASHPYDFTITNSNRLKWNFDNVHLPDSNVNEPASHGFVAYKIKPKSNVVLGDTIKNTASIYFDFNLPVKTNTQLTVVKNNLVTGIPTLNNDDLKVLIAPNPANSLLQCVISGRLNGKFNLSLIDINGRMIRQSSVTKNSSADLIVPVNVNTLPPGMYIIKLSQKNKTWIQKIIVQ